MMIPKRNCRKALICLVLSELCWKPQAYWTTTPLFEELKWQRSSQNAKRRLARLNMIQPSEPLLPSGTHRNTKHSGVERESKAKQTGKNERNSKHRQSSPNMKSKNSFERQPNKTKVQKTSQGREIRSTPSFGMPLERVKEKIQEVRKKAKEEERLTQSYCDTVLGLCVAYDEWESVLEILDIMKDQGYNQERSSYRACLQACFEAGNGASARDVLQAMEKANVAPEPWDIGLTVAAMCRQNLSEAGWWRKALHDLKEAAKNPSICPSHQTTIPVQAYNVVLECMLEDRQWKDAVRLLRLMEDSRSRPEEVGFHPIPEVSTYREVIECCVSSNQAEQAARVLYSMKDTGVKPSTYACELVIAALSRKRQWRRALELFDLMAEMGISKTVITYNTVIGACARSREVGMAKSLLYQMRQEGIQPDEVSFNSVIGGCASTGRWRDALTLLEQCHQEPGVEPNIYIYTNAMRACAKGGKVKQVLSLLEAAKDTGLPLDSYCYTSAIDACAKAGMSRKALALLEEMKAAHIAPSEVTYSVTISACGNAGDWEKALDLLQLMKSQGMSPNPITYNAALTALSKASRQAARSSAKKHKDVSESVNDSIQLWPKALAILKNMKEDGIEPDGFCYSSAISCCGAEGRWREALKLIEAMKQGDARTRPNRIAYTAAISACGRAGEADHALELFTNMKKEGLSADRVAYNSLFSALRIAAKPTEAFELWRELCGLEPLPRQKLTNRRGVASPDIITVTECLATLSRANALAEMDQVFEEAVERGLVLRGNVLDLQYEVDLSGMSLPVARAAVRYIVQQIATEEDVTKLQTICFITGVGRAKLKRKETPDIEDEDMTTLREYVQQILMTDLHSPIESVIPPRAQGTVEIPEHVLRTWREEQS